MYHIFKKDPWGNDVPWMSISHKQAADGFVLRNKDTISKVVEVPRNTSTLILL